MTDLRVAFITACATSLLFSAPLASLFREAREIRREFRSFIEESDRRELRSLATNESLMINLRDRVETLEASFATVPSRLEKLESSDGLSKKEMREVKRQVRKQVKKSLSSAPTGSLSLSPSLLPSQIPSEISSPLISSSPSFLPSLRPSVSQSQIPSKVLLPTFSCFNNEDIVEAVKLYLSNRTLAVEKYGIIGAWQTCRADNLASLFAETSFNQNLNGWDVSAVTSLKATFYNSRVFKGDISEWDVSSVYHFDYTFKYAVYFNTDINKWDVSSGSYFRNMFDWAKAFGHCLDWSIQDRALTNYMFRGSFGKLGPCNREPTSDSPYPSPEFTSSLS